MDRAKLDAAAAEIAEKLTEKQAVYLEGYVAGVAAILQHADDMETEENQENRGA